MGESRVHPTRRAFMQMMGLSGAAAAMTGCDAATDALAGLLSLNEDADFRPCLSNLVVNVGRPSRSKMSTPVGR